MSKAEKDAGEGTILPSDEAVLVTSDGMTSLELYMPAMGDDEHVPELALFLTACMLRANSDDEFVSEMIEWLVVRQND